MDFPRKGLSKLEQSARIGGRDSNWLWKAESQPSNGTAPIKPARDQAQRHKALHLGTNRTIYCSETSSNHDWAKPSFYTASFDQTSVFPVCPAAFLHQTGARSIHRYLVWSPVPIEEVSGKQQALSTSSHRCLQGGHRCQATGRSTATCQGCGDPYHLSLPALLIFGKVQLQVSQSLVEKGGWFADKVQPLAQGQGEPVGMQVEREVASLALLQLQPLQGDFRKLLW